MYKIFAKLFVLVFVSQITAQDFSPCGDWTAFSDEKCFKYFETIANYSTASELCEKQEEGSILAVIKSKEEQRKIIKILEESEASNSAWIGVSKIDGEFKNSDGTNLDYSNWLKNRPLINKTGLDCVEVSTFVTKTFGKWIDQRCQKHNAVVCQKLQPWTVDKLQNTLLDVKRDLEKEKTKVSYLQQNHVPIGFIYAQFPGQNEPENIWLNTEWENISPEFAGLFFRVEGGLAATFGVIQEQQTESIEIVDYGTEHNRPVPPNLIAADTPLTIKTYYQSIFSGATGYNWHFHRFKHNFEEIRPRNSAMKVWKRIK